MQNCPVSCSAPCESHDLENAEWWEYASLPKHNALRDPAHPYPWRAWVGLFSLLLILGCGTTLPLQTTHTISVPELPRNPTGFLIHTVKPKETLWSIGKRYGVSYASIMQANHLTDAKKLPSGSQLVIPRTQIPQWVPVYPNRAPWTHIVIHHSATSYGNAKILDRAHRRRGFSNGLGYHFLIDNGTSARGDGQIEVGHRWLNQQSGAHCNAGGMNSHGIGICLVGNFTHQSISPAQMAALLNLVHQLADAYRIPSSRIIRHRDVRGKSTACPGDRFPWTEFKRRLAVRLSQ